MSEKLEKLEFSQPANPNDLPSQDAAKLYDKGNYLWALAFYTLALSRKTGKTFDLDVMLEGDAYERPRGYITGTIDAIKRTKPCGIEIDGVTGKYLTQSFGSLNFEEILTFYENLKPKALSVRNAFEEVSTYFGRDFKWSDQDEPTLNSEAAGSEPLAKDSSVDEGN